MNVEVECPWPIIPVGWHLHWTAASIASTLPSEVATVEATNVNFVIVDIALVALVALVAFV